MLTDFSVPLKCTFDGWPKLSKEFAERMAKLKGSYSIRPLPAYGRNGDLITPNDYEKDLKGASVVVEFVIHHFQTELVKGDRQDHFYAEICRIRVLVPPPSAHNGYAMPVPVHDSTSIPPLVDLEDLDE